MRASRNHGCSRRSQQGLVFYAFVLVTIFVIAALFWAQTLWQGNREARDLKILQQAREAVLAHLAEPDLVTPPVRRLGQFGVLPDLAFTGQGAPLTQCAYRTWVPGAPLVSAEASGAAARCFGRLPWQSLGIDLGPVDTNDIQGRIPWLIVSPNLAVTKNCMPNLTPLVIGSPVLNTCPGSPSQLPFPWLTVVDERGNVLSNRVAFALIMPGPPVGGVARNATAAPAAWLNALQVKPGCPTPCVPGLYDNAGYQQANGAATALVATNFSDAALKQASWIADPRQYHNRVLWVSVDEMFRYLEARARKVIDTALTSFKSTNGYYPYAANFNDATGACTANLRFGHPATAVGNCGIGALQNLKVTSPWLTDAGWQQYFAYAVSPICVAASHACGAPGLTLNGSNGVNALLIGPGSPITAAPFAPSRGAPQAPLTLGALSPLPADYIDSTANVNGGATGTFANVAPSVAAPNDDRLDIVQ
jgi:hypothetical protein